MSDAANDPSGWGAELERFRARMRRLHTDAGPSARALGVPEWDAQLWRLGRAWLASHPELAPFAAESPAPCDVYLATQVYPIGGHTPLIGDFIRAQPGTAPHLILTNTENENPSPLPDTILARLGVTQAQVTILSGPSMLDRLHQLFGELLRLSPRRLFLFHHPGDPLASVVAHPEIAAQRVLVHHADSMTSFAIHLPGVRIIDLNPVASAMTRLLGRTPALLPLTAPDPGPRPGGFLRRGRLVTATSGSAQKIARPYFYSYADTVGVILRETGGWHLHIGPLFPSTRAEIGAALSRASIPPDRFIHVPTTPSVPRTLWEHGCDVYCASFPIDGARTRVDVLASATPYVAHRTHPDEETAGRLVWRTWEDLAAVLHRLQDAAVLAQQSAEMRALYESTHHPTVFAQTLAVILEGGSGSVDDDSDRRDQRAVLSLLRSLTTRETRDAEAAEQRQRIEHLEEECRRLQRLVEELRAERDREKA